MSGDCGPPYTSAVSKKLMPAARASSMILKLVASSVTMPKFIVPRARRLTCRPERPRDVYCILILLFPDFFAAIARHSRRHLLFLRFRLAAGRALGPTALARP